MTEPRPLILCEPSGGLCNRMRALASAIALAEDAGAILRVVWKNDVHLSCRFEELFTPPSGVASLHHFCDGLVYRFANYVICKSFRNRLEQTDVEALNATRDDLLALVRKGRLFIRTHSSFYKGGDFSSLKPVPGIVERIAGYRLVRAKTVGVHVRRTDNDIATLNSPTELFLVAMMKELEQDPETVFFVATDSPSEEEQLKKAFPGRVVSHPKPSFDRTKSQVIQDAMIDLYMLAQCRRLIGSYRSSFTDTAAAIGGIPLVVVQRRSVLDGPT